MSWNTGSYRRKQDEGGADPASLTDFYQYHQGGICLIVCNGPSLNLLPHDIFEQYITFGCNSIVEWDVFKPDYYVTVDDRVRREYGDAVNEKYNDVPKFIPKPNLNKWIGNNIYRWLHRPGPMWVWDGPWDENTLTDPGITWKCCPHAMMQIAYFMGFATILIVGMDHSTDYKRHAWGVDDDMNDRKDPRATWRKWEKGHRILMENFEDTEILNISPGTQERVLPKDDWRRWYAA